MRNLTSDEFLLLRRKPRRIRNICILAHVDHGKTTLADSLVANNGIISQRMAGKLRYMDNRPDEQERGITMKSSAISLHYQMSNRTDNFLINLIDSPGHVDFTGEVSTAVRLCDGAIVVVDVVEGCAPQTVQVLRQAWKEHIKPILVLNKIDRLIVEKKMTPMEAYQRLVQVLEQVNAVMGSLFTTKILLEQDQRRSEKSVNIEDKETFDWDAGLEEADDSSLYFQPELGNVAFVSAVDGWGFTTEHFAAIYSDKLKLSRNVLRKTLWGDFYINIKEKKVQRGALNKGKKPLFVQLILENIWQIYDAVCNKKDKDLTDKIVTALGLQLHARDAKQSDVKGYLFAICSQWLPLSKCILDMVCDKLPSPSELSEERIQALISNHRRFDSLPEETRKLKEVFLKCDSKSKNLTVAFVSKMFAVDPADISRTGTQRPTGQTLSMEEIAARRQQVRLLAAQAQKANQNSEGQAEVSSAVSNEVKEKPSAIFMGFARIFSGTLKEGDELYVLGPKHDVQTALLMEAQGATSFPHVGRVKVEGLYAMMGREMETVGEASVGNIVAIAGLQDHLVRSGTLSTSLACPAFTDLHSVSAPIVKVAVEPKRLADMEQLDKGLKLLYQADPCVEVYVQETGEHVLAAAGEVHLQKCLKDLTDTFAKIEINASEPIVAFRETVVPPPKVDMMSEAIVDTQENTSSTKKKALIEITTPNKQCTLRIRAIPLPAAASELLENSAHMIKTMHRSRKGGQNAAAALLQNSENQPALPAEMVLSGELKDNMEKLRNDLKEACKEEDPKDTNEILELMDKICSFGPRNCGPNILVNASSLPMPSVWSDSSSSSCTQSSKAADFIAPLLTGFQLSTLAGPLCEEPMMGVCFVLQDFLLAPEVAATTVLERRKSESPEIVNKEEASGGQVGEVKRELEETSQSTMSAYGPLSGQLIPTMKEGCRRAFQVQPQRLMVAQYSCIIQTTSDVLGKVYGVINRRRGRVLSDEMQEGSDVFNIKTVIPVCESFGFSEEILKKTSGLALPQLVFSHWEVLPIDPYWIPTTQEEYLHYGDKADNENIARRYMNQVRKRKGLFVEEKVVMHAEKQRTIGRNK
ncbi:hypothetical protein RvY_17448 [Ramazzottius varieornatus]|uniref:Ribosome assembly protein 1 n=1 Tax=Ramazzottius varieornatus TaxID=947166 RepID=A0A1D1W4C7_RAMVA|nr:hypothetical protein RvY_17448 [Ramazzottius varieornatus]